MTSPMLAVARVALLASREAAVVFTFPGSRHNELLVSTIKPPEKGLHVLPAAAAAAAAAKAAGSARATRLRPLTSGGDSSD